MVWQSPFLPLQRIFEAARAGAYRVVNHKQMEKKDLHIVQVGDVLVSPDIFTEKFCCDLDGCDLDACKGQCCVEGDAGAPVTLDEIAAMEDALDEVWGDLSAQAQAVIDKQGVSYIDEQGDLVTSIVNGRDCVFTCYEGLNYNRWRVCAAAVAKGEKMGLPVYKFLERPLIRRFGKEWYDELCLVAKELLGDEA